MIYRFANFNVDHLLGKDLLMASLTNIIQYGHDSETVPSFNNFIVLPQQFFLDSTSRRMTSCAKDFQFFFCTLGPALQPVFSGAGVWVCAFS